jgi:hypothetical protein
MRGLALRRLCAGRWGGFRARGGSSAWAVRRAPLARLARRAFGGYRPPALAHRVSPLKGPFKLIRGSYMKKEEDELGSPTATRA